jgi:hypothetical protein
MFHKELTHAGHTKRFVITEAGSLGWEFREEQDSHVLRKVCYTDWHRVERAISALSRHVVQLEREGWTESRSGGPNALTSPARG